MCSHKPKAVGQGCIDKCPITHEHFAGCSLGECCVKDLVLIVEDDSCQAEVLVDLLIRCGLTARLLVLRNGEEVLAYLKGEAPYADREHHPLPKVLLLDLIMKGIDGLEVLAWMQTQPQFKIRMYVLTSPMNLNQMTRAYELGASSFLTKPFAEHELRSMVGQLNKILSS